MKYKIVPVKNISRLTAAQRALLSRAPGTPGMGVVHGPAGYGKTIATAWLSNQVPSIAVRAMALWTPSAMLGAILRELRMQPGGSCASQVERIVEALARTEHSLFIDEVHYIARSTRLVETLRDIHDLATVPVILIGEEGIVQQLSHLRRLTSRIAQDVQFQPLDLEDTAMIAQQLCEVEIREDMLARIHQQTHGNCRNTVVALGRIEQTARAKGLQRVGVADIGSKVQLFTGDASPMPVAA